MNPPNNPEEDGYFIKGIFKGHTSDVRVIKAARFPKGGFVTGSRDNLVKLWVPDSGSKYKDEYVFMGAKKYIGSLCALPESAQFPNGLILAGSHDCAIYGFTLSSKEPVMKLLGHSGAVCSLSAGFGLFVSGSWDGTARVWSGQQCTSVLEGHGETVWATEVYPLQNMIITASADKTIRIWRQGACENVLYGHTDCVRGLVITKDLKILSCSNDATIRRWNIKGICLNVFESHDSYIYSITLLNNGIDFATCGEDEKVKIWKRGTCVQTIAIPSKTLWSVACVANGDLVVGCSDGSVYIIADEAATFDTNYFLKDFFKYYLEIDGELCKLMFNKNDDPYEVAVDFIDDHKLDPLYLSAIVDYIEQSRASSKLPFSYNEYFPVQTYYKYLKANVAGLKAKLLEFTDFVSKPHHIPPSKIESLVLLTSYPEQVTQEQLGSLDLVISWDDEYLFPALDLLRLAIRCEGVSVKIGSAALINHLLHILRNTKLCVNRVLIVKIFCNLFDVKDGVELMIKFQAKICGTVKEAVLSTEKTHKSASSLLFNYAVAAFHDLPLDIDLYCLDLIDMMKVIVDSDSLYRIFAAVGTLCFANRPAFMFLQSLNFYDLVLPCQKHATGNANAVLKKLLEAFHP
ncbi:Phospholipase A-2-activating protein like [Argiope bruennichi]|uniref:Phospholipase A-2-activating protein like n=1 Tax=Argiope bruennichi TaxID=94029 RepID=A0A8T0F2X0_ARGBR|nr:Phospholipase A-2-activating protein like [Argiope bruennichi]